MKQWRACELSRLLVSVTIPYMIFYFIFIVLHHIIESAPELAPLRAPNDSDSLTFFLLVQPFRFLDKTLKTFR